MAMSAQKFERGFFFALLLLVGYLTFLIFFPYLYTLLLAITIAVMVWPIHERVQRALKGSITSAIASTLLVVLVVLLPLTAIGFQLFFEVKGIYVYLTSYEGEASFITTAIGNIERSISSYFPSASLDVSQYAQNILQWLLANLGSIFSSLFLFAIHTFLFLLALFFIFRDGDRLLGIVKRLSPLSDRDDQRIFDTLGAAINSVVRGALVIALVQGVLAGIGLTLFGVPNSILWGSVTVIAALIPTLGTSLVMLPSVLYLLAIGSTVPAIGLGLWAISAVGLVDNFLGPYLISKGAQIHPFLILLSVLGGLSLFGAFGFILGPLVISLFLALLHIYLDFSAKMKG